MLFNLLPVLFIIALGMLYALRAGKLTLAAAITGAIIAMVIFIGTGYTGLFMMVAFFLLGTLATSWKGNVKMNIGLAEENKGRRTAGQVIANAGVAGLLAACSIADKSNALIYLVMLAACFSSATADTLSSELGNVYGRRFYNIINFKKDKRGLNGVVSIEGIVIGIMGSCMIALIYFIACGWDKNGLIIVIAGTVGNLSDSILGATLERKQVLNNNAVNFLNTVIAVVTAWLLYNSI